MSDFKIGRMVVGMVSTNCYFLFREKTKEAVLIDPAAQGDSIYESLEQQGLKVKAILLTHGHFDHIMGVKKFLEKCEVPVYAHEKEGDLLQDANMNVSAQFGRNYTIKADNLFTDLQTIELAGFSIQVIHTPGHTKGSCCYYLKDEKVVFSGDTLFEESVGRTDFPTGSQSELVRSIREKLMALDDEIVVYPGHGETTTIGHERQHNPFF